MRFSSSDLRLWAHEFAVEIIGKSELMTEYDAFGNPSHILAVLPQDEFLKLYTPDTVANVFWHGYWAQFVKTEEGYFVLGKAGDLLLEIHIAFSESGQTEVRIWENQKLISAHQLNLSVLPQFSSSPFTFQEVVKVVFRTLKRKIAKANLPSYVRRLPCIYVVPDDSPSEFNPDKVFIQ